MQQGALQKPRRRIGATVTALSAAFLFFLSFPLFSFFFAGDADALTMCGMRPCKNPPPPVPTNVNIINSGAAALYIGFTGSITWVSSTGCSLVGTGLRIAAGATCAATAAYNNASTRFCAVVASPGAVIPNCASAQLYNWTMVETTFQPASAPGCFGKGVCVWYDISVIPHYCTDALWKLNQCAGTGGASYNLPVQLTCSNQPTYTCQGPTSTLYGPQNYPSNCGNPNSWMAVPPVVPQAYFFPMYDPPENAYQPNAGCLGGNILNINFLAGS
jgi:hypothetical protein